MAIPKSETLAAMVEALGGQMVEARTFRFDLPLQDVKSVVPKIQNIDGEIGVRKVDEYQAPDPKRASGNISIARLELYRRQTGNDPNFSLEHQFLARIVPYR